MGNDGNFIINLQRLQKRVRDGDLFGGAGGAGRGTLVLLGDTLGHHAVRRVHVVLKLLVHAEGGRAHGALVGQVGRLQSHVVVACHVVQQLPLVHAAAGGAAPGVFAAVGCLLHGAGDQPVRAQQMAL